MHVLFVHRNFPAQFGHIASHLARHAGWRCTFVSERPPLQAGGVANIQYALKGGATERTHVLARTFENGCWHAAAVYDALRPVSAALRPDLIVGHSGFGSTLLLTELYPDVPLLNYFEYFYRSRGSDLDFRPDVPVEEIDRLRSPARNAMILLDLEYCAAGYTPTRYQASLLPSAYAEKVTTLHDGIDTSFWRPRELSDRALGQLRLEPGERLVTYVSRGLESMRGFDVFMKAARRICEARDDVKVIVVGSEKVHYGGDLRRTAGRTFKEHVLAADSYPLDRIRFSDQIPPDTLAQLFSLTDVHVYLTVPFVLSWSLLDAMACEAPIVASATAPVQEIIEDGVNGRLVDFFDDAALAQRTLELLDDPPGARAGLGAAARQTVLERYAMDVTMPRMQELYMRTAGR
jgi:glycosyltransferase involved in cell wall biosynthesis